MRTIPIRWLSPAALVLLAFGGNAAAQDKSQALLNTLEVQELGPATCRRPGGSR